MTQPLPDTWSKREVPVLREAARLLEQASLPGAGARLSEIAHATGLPTDQVRISVMALADAGLVEVQWVAGPRSRIVRMSAHARQIVGLWPSDEAALDRIVRALEALAAKAGAPGSEQAADALEAFRAAGKAFEAIGVAAITGDMP